MWRRLRRTGAAAAVFAAAVACAGCGGGAPTEQKAPPPDPAKPDAVEVSWTGYVSRSYEGELGVCVEALKIALKRLNLQITEDHGGMFSTDFEAEARDGTSLVLEAKEIAKDRVKVSVKVGYFLGDREASQRILSEIEDELNRRRAEATDKQRLWSKPTPGAGSPSTTSPPSR